MKLFAETLGGNLFGATSLINKYCPEIIPGIVAMSCSSPYDYTIVVYRAEKEPVFFAKRNTRVDPYPASEEKRS
jgi:hypothetical protein